MTIKYIGKCLFIRENKEKILVIGDLHFGLENSLVDRGVFILLEMIKNATVELDKVFKKIGKVNRIILSGDIKHNFGKISGAEWGEITTFFDYLQKNCDEIIVIKGNHDVLLAPIAKNRKVQVRDYYILNEYCFLHGNKDYEEIKNRKIKYWIMGHMHPAITLIEGVKMEKYKCFLEGKYKDKTVIILPSFHEYSIGNDPRGSRFRFVWKFDLSKFKVKVVGENLKVLDFGILKKIK